MPIKSQPTRQLLESLRPLAGRIRVVALCGRRAAARQQLLAWAQAHPELEVEPLGFQDPAGMARLYRRAWLMVARPGARTATEALASGCLLVFNGFGGFMPQEWMARRYFAARGFDLAVRQPEHRPHDRIDQLAGSGADSTALNQAQESW